VTVPGPAAASVGSMKMLYPYDQTVFPGGIPAPVLQWSQTGTPDGVYAHFSSQLFDYKICFAGSSPTNFTMASTGASAKRLPSCSIQGDASGSASERATVTRRPARK